MTPPPQQPQPRKIPLRAIILPAILGVWLAVMVALGWSSFRLGLTPAWLYFGGTAVCIACIIGLHFHLRRPRRSLGSNR